MLIKGEKWACEACVRGHRVSNCQHQDRPLQHINKKGRPVSQCTHCRSLRKSRSAHVRCDCAEKGHSKGSCPNGTETQADECCCSHGGRCSCALKKEHLDPVPESDSDDLGSTTSATVDSRRPRAFTSPSDSGLTIFTNGHHKPVQKHNKMAHKCGLPYVVPRAHSLHGLAPSGLANRSVDNLPHTSTVEALHSDSHMKDSIVSAQQEQRMVKSEHGSPLLGVVSNLDQLNSDLPPLDISSLPTDYNFLQNMDAFSAMTDPEQPLFSAGLSATSIDWSHYDGLDFNNDDFATSSYSQAASFTGYDFNGADLQPALTTTSTSGEISEVEDYPQLDNNAHSGRSALLNDQFASDLPGTDGYLLSATSSFIPPQSQMLGGAIMGPIETDPFSKSAESSTTFATNGLPSTTYDDSKPISTFANGFPSVPTAEVEGNFWYGDFNTNNTTNLNENGEGEIDFWGQ